MVQIFYSHHLDLPLQTLSIQCWGNNHQNLWSQCWCFLWSLQLSRWWIVKLSSRCHWSLDWSWKNSSLLLLESENIKYHQLSWLISFVAEKLIRMKSIFLEGQLSATSLQMIVRVIFCLLGSQRRLEEMISFLSLQKDTRPHTTDHDSKSIFETKNKLNFDFFDVM